MDWEHINAFGRGVERVLCLVTVASVTVTVALLLLKFEWEHLPAEARRSRAARRWPPSRWGSPARAPRPGARRILRGARR